MRLRAAACIAFAAALPAAAAAPVEGLPWPPVLVTRADEDDRDWRRLWSLDAPRAANAGRGGVEACLPGIDREDARFAAGRGDERRESQGLRLFGRGGDRDWNTAAVLQGGRLADRRIRAWTLATETGWRPAWRLEPRFSRKANATGGDDDPRDGVLGTFNARYPRGSHFGRLSSVGPYNHIDLQPEVSFKPGATTEFPVAQVWFWRHSRADGVTGGPGNLLLAPAGSRARAIGRQPQSARLDAEPAPRLRTRAGAVRTQRLPSRGRRPLDALRCGLGHLALLNRGR